MKIFIDETLYKRLELLADYDLINISKKGEVDEVIVLSNTHRPNFGDKEGIFFGLYLHKFLEEWEKSPNQSEEKIGTYYDLIYYRDRKKVWIDHVDTELTSSLLEKLIKELEDILKERANEESDLIEEYLGLENDLP